MLLIVPLLGVLMAPARPEATSSAVHRLEARVVWTRGDRVYVAARDSLPFAVGWLVEFRDGDRALATGTVTGVLEGAIIAARIGTGSLQGAEKLDRLTVIGTPPAAPGRSLLRVGYPSSKRVHPLFRCASSLVARPGYRADTLGERSFRLVRDSTQVVMAPGPDTLLVRLFDEVADQEIALERGEIDAAVFRPGEASIHIREVMGWRGQSPLARSWGVVALEPARAERNTSLHLDPADFSLLQTMNRELFRADLIPLWDGTGAPDSVATARSSTLRFEVDPSCPGKQTLERFLNRNRRPSSDPHRWIRLTYQDREIGLSTHDPPVGGVFMLGYPVISRPEVRGYVEAIDDRLLIDLIDCRAGARRP